MSDKQTLLKIRYFLRNKYCMEGPETSHTRLPKKAPLINAKKNGSHHSGPGKTQVLIYLN